MIHFNLGRFGGGGTSSGSVSLSDNDSSGSSDKLSGTYFGCSTTTSSSMLGAA